MIVFSLNAERSGRVSVKAWILYDFGNNACARRIQNTGVPDMALSQSVLYLFPAEMSRRKAFLSDEEK
jgi:hypothetical protein